MKRVLSISNLPHEFWRYRFVLEKNSESMCLLLSLSLLFGFAGITTLLSRHMRLPLVAEKTVLPFWRNLN